jgi:hypothetical protein
MMVTTGTTSFAMFLALTLLLLAVLAVAVRAIDLRRWVPAGLAAVGAAVAVVLLGGVVLCAWYASAQTTQVRVAHEARAEAVARLDAARAAQADAVARVKAAREAMSPAGIPMTDATADEAKDVGPAEAEGAPTAAEPPAGEDEPLAIPIGAETAARAKRPAWVDSPPLLTGEVLQKPIASEPYEKLRDCSRDLDRQLKQAVAEYIDDYFDESYGDRLKASDWLQYDANYIKSHLVKPGYTYHEIAQLSVGPMQRMHALLVFDDAFRKELEGRRAELDRHWRDRVTVGRVLAAGLGFGLVLGLLGLVWGYLKLDTRTGGKNSRRLQLAGGTAILALMAAVVLLARQIR